MQENSPQDSSPEDLKPERRANSLWKGEKEHTYSK